MSEGVRRDGESGRGKEIANVEIRLISHMLSCVTTYSAGFLSSIFFRSKASLQAILTCTCTLYMWVMLTQRLRQFSLLMSLMSLSV